MWVLALALKMTKNNDSPLTYSESQSSMTKKALEDLCNQTWRTSVTSRQNELFTSKEQIRVPKSLNYCWMMYRDFQNGRTFRKRTSSSYEQFPPNGVGYTLGSTPRSLKKSQKGVNHYIGGLVVEN